MSIKNLVLHAAKLSAYVIGSGPQAERLIESLEKQMAFEKQITTDLHQAFEDMGFKKRAVLKSLQVNKYSLKLKSKDSWLNNCWLATISPRPLLG